jgi:hypothetical protein
MRIFAIATSLQAIAVRGSRTSKSILNPVFSFLRLSSDSVILSTSGITVHDSSFAANMSNV